MATVNFSAADRTLYAYLAGEIDHDAAQNLRIQLDEALVSRTPETLIMDFSGVGFMDSSGVGLILGRQRRAQALGAACVSSMPLTNCAVCCSWHRFPATMCSKRRNKP